MKPTSKFLVTLKPAILNKVNNLADPKVSAKLLKVVILDFSEKWDKQCTTIGWSCIAVIISNSQDRIGTKFIPGIISKFPFW